MSLFELINTVKPFGPLGLFFLVWFFDKKAMERTAHDTRTELKESNKRWYDLGQRMENHMLTMTGALTELRSMQREITDRLDVLLRRGDRG